MRRVVLVFLVLVAGCTASPSSDADLVLSEFSIESAVSAIDSGAVNLDVVNTGEFGHTVVVADSTGRVVSASPLIQAGETMMLELDLEPGWYEFTCRIVFQSEDGAVVDHYEEGMHTRIDVQE